MKYIKISINKIKKIYVPSLSLRDFNFGLDIFYIANI